MKTYIVILLFAVSLSGCVSLNSLQSGRTLGEGNANISVSLTNGKYELNSPALDENDDYFNYDFVPILELGAKYGITENFDVALRFNSAGYLSGQVKYQFLGNKKSLFATSIGADAGSTPMGEMFHILNYYISVPLYLSIHPTEDFCFYITPRYSYSSFGYFDQNSDSTYIPATHYKFGSFSYGMIIGKRNKLIIEITHSQNNRFKPTQVSIGFTSNFDMKGTHLYKSFFGE